MPSRNPGRDPGHDSDSYGRVTDYTNANSGKSYNGGNSDDLILGSQYNDTFSGGKGADRIEGGAGNDVLDGNRGSDTVKGGAGNDTITGGKGNDTLTGGTGSDTFIFERDDDKDVITDFDPGNDTILFEGFGNNRDSFNEIMNNASNQNGNVVINMGSGDELTLEGLSKSDLSSDDFSFG
ncbi:calcium-binding protein [Flexibacterium corallicola]|uniref:calcium-binding protein n=1 Tax=Flexibacterium corallicola TaxID=3037259 RepID=UPI00386216D4